MNFLTTSKYTGYLISVELVGWGLCIGALIAISLSFFDQRVVGAIVRRLIGGSTSPENAISLKEMNMDKGIYKFALNHSIAAKKAISIIPSESEEKSNKEYLYNAKLFISNDSKEFAEKRYEKKPKVWIFVVTIVVILILGILLHVFLPMGLEYIENY